MLIAYHSIVHHFFSSYDVVQLSMKRASKEKIYKNIKRSLDKEQTLYHTDTLTYNLNDNPP